jgi:small nuclear ribonucleoprotein (snRNP)-like protein
MKPMDTLGAYVGKKVTVVFKNGEERKGILKNYDDYINITLATQDGALVIKGSKISLIVL